MNECKYENIIYVRYILLTYTIIHQYPISTPIILLLLGGNKKMTAPNLQGSQEGGCSHGEACEACEAWGTNFGPVGNHTSSTIWAFFLFTNCLEKKHKIKRCYDVFLTIWIVGSPHLYPCVTTKCESISVGRMMINGFKLPPPKFIQQYAKVRLGKAEKGQWFDCIWLYNTCLFFMLIYWRVP